MKVKLLTAAVLIILMTVSYFLTIVIHEFGHLCMGLLSGYSFVTFRIGSLELAKSDGRLKINIKNIPGTAGQCIMIPPYSTEPEKVPAALYHLGGGLFNILTGLTAVCLIPVTEQKYVKAFLLFIGMFSFMFALINLVPTISTVPNDGYNLKLCLNSPADRKAMYQMLCISGNLTQSPGEMSEEVFSYSEEGFYSPIMKMLKGSYHMDRGEFTEAEKLLEESADKEKDPVMFYRMEAKKELLYCRLLRNASGEEIKALFDDELREYLEKTRTHSIGSCRVLYAYHSLFEKDRTSADKELKQAESLLTKVSTSEMKMERRLLNRVTELSKEI